MSPTERPRLEDLPEILTVPHHLVPFLGLSEALIYDCIRRGDLPSVHLGRRIVVSKSALIRWLDGARDDRRQIGAANNLAGR